MPRPPCFFQEEDSPAARIPPSSGPMQSRSRFPASRLSSSSRTDGETLDTSRSIGASSGSTRDFVATELAGCAMDLLQRPSALFMHAPRRRGIHGHELVSCFQSYSSWRPLVRETSFSQQVKSSSAEERLEAESILDLVLTTQSRVGKVPPVAYLRTAWPCPCEKPLWT